MMRNGGLNKLSEECSELTVVNCKTESALDAGLGYTHYDGTDLKARLVEEMGDVSAAMHYVIEKHKIDILAVQARAEAKMQLFRSWENDSQN